MMTNVKYNRENNESLLIVLRTAVRLCGLLSGGGGKCKAGVTGHLRSSRQHVCVCASVCRAVTGGLRGRRCFLVEVRHR